MSPRMLVTSLLVFPLYVAPLASQECNVPVMRRGTDGFSLRFETVMEGGAVALQPRGVDRVLAPIIPVGPGMSGDIVKRSEEDLLLLRCLDGMVRVFRTPPDGGSAQEVMKGSVADLVRFTLRVNAVGADGEEAAFEVRNGKITPASGPVLNMFRGMIPLEEGDVVLTTEVKEAGSTTPTDLAGTVELGSLGPYASVPVELPGERVGHFILDLGASRSLVARDFLDPGIPVHAMVAVEHSADGTRELVGTAQGAGGSAEGVASMAEVPWVRVGAQELQEFRPLVLDQPFKIGGEAIQGIVGLDILRRAGRVVGNFSRPTEPATIRFGGEPLAGAVEIPFQEVRGLLLVEGFLGEVPTLFLLDSGARECVVPEILARREGWEISEEAVDSLMGLDRNPIPFRAVQPPPLTVGDVEYRGATFITGPIPVLDALGIGRDAAILGQPFFKALGTVEIDFAKGVLRIPPSSPPERR